MTDDDAREDSAAPPSPGDAPRPGDRPALWLATLGGVGRLPGAPGTWGTLATAAVHGAALWWWLEAGGGPAWVPAAASLALATIATVAGIWAGDRARRLFGDGDPGAFVLDEAAGWFVTAAVWLPLASDADLVRLLVGGFVLFRLFDVLKPWPCRRLESLPGGAGIVLDDLAAGAWACVVLHGILGVW